MIKTPEKQPSRDPAEELAKLRELRLLERDEVDQQVMEANRDIMVGERSVMPGGFRYEIMKESYGGNAGTEERDGVRLTRAAANCIVDVDTGEIITFTNYSDGPMKELTAQGYNVAHMTLLKAMPSPKFDHEKEAIIFEQVPGWTRPDNIVAVGGYKGSEFTSNTEELLPDRALANLMAGVDEFNSQEQPFVMTSANSDY